MTTWSDWEDTRLADARLRGLGPKSLEKLARGGLETLGDLLTWLPRAYLDFSKVTPIEKVVPDSPLHVRGRILSMRKGRTGKKRIGFLEMLIEDSTGTLRVMFFHQVYLGQKTFAKGKTVSLFGSVRLERNGYTMTNPKYDLNEDAGGIHSVYRQVGGLRSEQLAKWIAALLPRVFEPDIPLQTKAWQGLPSRREALEMLHRPEEPNLLPVEGQDLAMHPAGKRLILDEFYAFNQRLSHLTKGIQQRSFPRLETKNADLEKFLTCLPFQPTGDQLRCVHQLFGALSQGKRLHALVQGDVGCGKTLVGLAISYVFLRAGLQCALLCPTTVLARQHAESARQLLPSDVQVAFLTADTPADESRRVLTALDASEPLLVTGTHRLFQKDVAFGKLGLVMVDEQHRFGVHQRSALLKKGVAPHYLAFSATPIPRSLALTLYGDLAIHQIREKPSGRLPVQTRVEYASNRDEVLAFVSERLALGEAGYWVLPNIEEGESGSSAIAVYDELRSGPLRAYRVGLVHGRLSRDDMRAQMLAFRAGEIDLLVATTVIEVGVDVGRATVMVVENADRFGLSQLHQLRGRVGRANREGTCIYFLDPPVSERAEQRVNTLLETNDGFEIAEKDLAERGSGHLLGSQQSGESNFRIGDPWRHRHLMEAAKALVLS